MLALVYVTASVLGGVALFQYYEVPPLTAALIGATASLAMIQLHALIAKLKSNDAEKELYEIRQEMRRLQARQAQNENYTAELKSSFDKEVLARRETIVNEMRGLEDMISKLGKKFESRLQVVRASSSETTTLDGACSRCRAR